MTSDPPGALQGLRVLDVAGAWASFGTKMLADLGADVIVVEPPGGHELRHRGPFVGGTRDIERSTSFILQNGNKRSVTLDLDSVLGTTDFRRLVTVSDIVVESGRPGELDARGIGYRSLAESNPRLIWAAVTPFGQDGPFANFEVSELSAQAMGGALYLTGEPRERPVLAGGHVAEKMSGYMAALALANAVYWRDQTGWGQFIDLSVQEAVVSQMESFTTKIVYTGEVYARDGRLYPRTYPAGIFPAADGWVSLVAGPLHQWRALRDWIADSRLNEPAFEELGTRMAKRSYLDEIICAWTKRHEKYYLFHEGQRRRVPVGVSLSPAEVTADPHLRERGYIVRTHHPTLGEAEIPGAPYLISRTPWALRRPAPLLGEHNAEIVAELNAGPERQAGPTPAARAPVPGALPLDGVRVLDLTWIIAGPVCTKLLADQGADVIKVESAETMDPIRVSGPFLHGIDTAPDGGGTFTHYNRNKRSITLNLKMPAGRQLLLDLVKQSDVIVNNYSAGVMDRLGLGYDVLRAANPRLIVAELSGMGQTGQYRSYVAFGMTLMAMSGAYELTGYPDGSPLMPGYTFTDFAGAAMGAFAIISALHWRNQSGAGQYLDLGQYQMGAALFADEQFEFLVTGRRRSREGNAAPGAFVHGVYRNKGPDEWCTIAAWTPEQWSSLADAGAVPAALAGVVGSLKGAAARRAEIDDAVERWTSKRTSREVMLALQAVGIEAARVQTAHDLMRDDEHLAAREYFQKVTHLTGEVIEIDGMPFRMSATPAAVRSPGPIYGADNEDVFHGLLGLPLEVVRRLQTEGVIA